MSTINTTAPTQISAFNKSTLPVLRAAIDAALKQIAEQYGLESLEVGSMRFESDGSAFGCQMTGKVKAENNPAALERQKMNSGLLGYDRNIVGEIFISQGHQYRVTDFDFKRPKYPILAVRVMDNKPYKFGASKALPFENKEIKYDANANIHRAS